MSIALDVERIADQLVVRWRSARGSGEARFDHLPDVVPEWLGPAHDLLDGASRRDEGEILDALATWAADAGVVVGIWHDDAGVEVLP